MKKGLRTPLFAFFALALMVGAVPAPCLATEKGEATTINKDGTAFVKESRVTQAERQAAADRAKAKGFVAPKVMEPATMPGGVAPTEQNPPNNGGPVK